LTLLRQGALVEAERNLRGAIEAFEAAGGLENPDLGVPLRAYATVQTHLGCVREAFEAECRLARIEPDALAGAGLPC
jgi:hypothetical protein